MKTAVIYARYSSDKQTEQSIEGQLRVCYDYAERNNITIVGTYIDRAISGKTDNRAEFQRMLRDSHKQAWNNVLVYKLDRFSRNKYEMAIHKRTLRDNGAKVISATENIPDTPEGIILESLLEGMAEYYSAELAQKVARGMNETRQKGNFTGGNLLYGYKKEGKKVVIDETTAPYVRYIFEQYANEVSTTKIIKSLYALGIPSPEKSFHKNTIHGMLVNEKYIGIYRYKDEVFTNMYPAIIDKNLFDIVQERVKSNKYGRKSEEVNYILSSKLRCGYCGKPITADCAVARSGETMRYYKCSTRKRGGKCENSTIHKEVLEDLITKVILAFLTPENINVMAEKIIIEQEKLINSNDKIKQLYEQRDKVNFAIKNLLQAIENGVYSTSTKERLNELELQKQNISEEIAIEEVNRKIRLTEKDIKKYLSKLVEKTPAKMIRGLIDEIVFYNDRLEIKCKYTNKHIPDGEKPTGISFYNHTHSLSMIGKKIKSMKLCMITINIHI